MLECIDHVNLVVEDLAAMSSFYRDTFGMRLTKRATIRGGWIEVTTGLENTEADVVYLEARPGAGLELICYRTPAGPRPEGLEAPNTKGIRHVAFRVTNMEAAVSSLRVAGVELLSEVQQVPAEQVDFADKRKRIVYCRDPEGNLLELCSYD